MATAPGTETKPPGFTTTFVGATYAKATEGNLAIAKSARGIGNLEQVISPVSLEQGTIDTTNGSATVVGTGTNFTNLLVGKYIFYYDMEGEPVVLGKVLTVSSTSSLTMTGHAGSTQNDVYFGFADTILGRNDRVLLRIPVVVRSGSIVMPYWDNYREANDGDPSTWYNSDATNYLNRISQIGSPITPAGPVNIQYTIEPLYGYVPTSTIVGNQSVEVYFTSTSQFPQFCFALLTPYGNTNQAVPANALYKLFSQENFSLNGLVVTTNFLRSQLELAGY